MSSYDDVADDAVFADLTQMNKTVAGQGSFDTNAALLQATNMIFTMTRPMGINVMDVLRVAKEDKHMEDFCTYLQELVIAAQQTPPHQRN